MRTRPTTLPARMAAPRVRPRESERGVQTFESSALARKGDLELRLQRARERLPKNPSMSSLVALYVDMIAVIDKHIRPTTGDDR